MSKEEARRLLAQHMLGEYLFGVGTILSPSVMVILTSIAKLDEDETRPEPTAEDRARLKDAIEALEQSLKN